MFKVIVATMVVIALSVIQANTALAQDILYEDIIQGIGDNAPRHNHKVRVDDWNFEFDGKEKFSIGRQFPNSHGWTKFLIDTKDLSSIEGLRLQHLAYGKADNRPWAHFASLGIPVDGRVTLFTDANLQLFQLGDSTSLCGVVERFGPLDDWALDQFRVGGELQHRIKALTLKGRCTFGSGDPQFQLWIVAPVS